MRYRVAVAFVFLGFTASWVLPQVPAGPEFQVNTYTPWHQWVSSLAADAAGNFVVAWTSDSQDGSGYGVFARRYDPSGLPRGPEFQVNTYTTGRQAGPSVAADAAGNFVVAWMSDGQDGSGRGVFARRYDASGLPRASEFQVNAYTTGGQGGVAVTVDAARNFVIAWAGAGEGDGYGVFVRRYDASGAPRGPEFRANSSTAGDQWGPALASDAAGRLIVAWSGYLSVNARRYDASGAPIGGQFRVDTPDPWNLWFSEPAVAADTAGNFVVVWSRQDYWPPAMPRITLGPGESGVFGQRYDAAGAARGAQFTVTASFINFHSASVSSDAAGDFVVVWDRKPDGSGSGVFSRRYDASGTLRGSEFRVNSYVPLDQSGPMVASDASGNLFAAWTSNGQDGNLYGVFGQRFGGILPAALAVDTAPSPGSDGNRVLEPGEPVDVRPSWRNVNGAAQTFDGNVLSFNGPPANGVSYQLLDSVGAYGTVPNGATAPCSDCYQAAVAFGGTRPSFHWDATLTERLTPDALGQTKPWAIHVGESFVDVSRTSPYYRFVETLLHKGVTAGCASGAYCPSSPTTREQMPAFVLLAREGAGYAPTACSPPNLFADVPETSIFCDVIEELARRGVVSGCGGGNYCPTSAVTREQMAVFVLRTLDPALSPPACTTPTFGDVPASSPFCRWIEELARRGVVTGCGGGNYCPTSPVTREQMAVFVSVTFGLNLYGP